MAQLFSGLAMSVDASSKEHKRLIFSHEGNARAAASVILIGVVAALIGSVFMAIGPKVKTTSRAAVDASVGAASTPVRIVGQAPHNNAVPCDQQVWPNIDQRCLVRTQAASKSEDISSTARSNEPTPSSAPTTQTPSQVAASGSTQPCFSATDGTPATVVEPRGLVGRGNHAVVRRCPRMASAGV